MHQKYLIIYLIFIIPLFLLISINQYNPPDENFSISSQVKYFSQEIGPRPAASDNESKAAYYLESQMRNYGVDTEIQDFKYYSLNSKAIKKSQNVIGTIKGVSSKEIIICADLDTVRDKRYGKYVDGANDDASSLAIIMALAKKYGKKKPYLTIKLIGFGASEESFTFPIITPSRTCLKPESYYKILYTPYLIGSRYYVLTHQEELENMFAVISLEATGTGTPCFIGKDAFVENNLFFVNFLVSNAKLHGINAQNIDFTSFEDESKTEGAISHVYLPFSYAGIPSTFLTCMNNPNSSSSSHNTLEIPEYLTLNDTYDNLVKNSGNEDDLEQHLQMVFFVVDDSIGKLSALYSMNNYFE
ncbi:M28 family metallopeptidase [Methanobacterium alcaliphilum]|uniref:M28 family metallopeptidase n=1 Tax=Methanobacterium alcaliphilum TaxID=392018 RepID=UPI00200AF22D|nr:M28 family peptidase [Methanobacterium alcaliphilum]MCK9151000.1 M28 family peptidase [Methanobacterium alcaliphilum]